MTTYFKTVWHDHSGNTHGWSTKLMTRAEAEKQLQEDKAYFYNDIRIELVEVTETVIETTHGNNQRPTK